MNNKFLNVVCSVIVIVWLAIMFCSVSFGVEIGIIISTILAAVVMICLTVMAIVVIHYKHLEKMKEYGRNDLSDSLMHKKDWEGFSLYAEQKRSELRIEEKTKLQELELDKKKAELNLKFEAEQFEYDLNNKRKQK